jgi:hypothetical protein
MIVLPLIALAVLVIVTIGTAVGCMNERRS